MYYLYNSLLLDLLTSFICKLSKCPICINCLTSKIRYLIIILIAIFLFHYFFEIYFVEIMNKLF